MSKLIPEPAVSLPTVSFMFANTERDTTKLDIDGSRHTRSSASNELLYQAADFTRHFTDNIMIAGTNVRLGLCLCVRA